MKFVAAILFAVLALGLTPSASAEPPTQAQLKEFNQLVDKKIIDRAGLEEFLKKYRWSPDLSIVSTHTVRVICDLHKAFVTAGLLPDDDPLTSPFPFYREKSAMGRLKSVSPEKDCKDGQTEVVLVRLSGDLWDRDEVFAELDKRRLRPANISALIAFSNTHWEVLRREGGIDYRGKSAPDVTIDEYRGERRIWVGASSGYHNSLLAVRK